MDARRTQRTQRKKKIQERDLRGWKWLERFQVLLAALSPFAAAAITGGDPYKTTVKGQTIFLCCEGCEEKLKKDPDKYLAGSFTVMKGDEEHEVEIEFDAWGTDLVRGRQWHSSQVLSERPGGGARLTMRLNSLEEIERWILSWGVHARVIGAFGWFWGVLGAETAVL